MGTAAVRMPKLGKMLPAATARVTPVRPLLPGPNPSRSPMCRKIGSMTSTRPMLEGMMKPMRAAVRTMRQRNPR